MTMSLLSVVVLAAAAATPPPVVVRVGVDLVQTDAVVTDGNGRHVTDLEAKDFELVEDGKVRDVTHCQYVILSPAPARVPSRLAAEDVRRVFAFVIDDNGLSLDSNDLARQALAKFIEAEMGPGDLVAVGRTGYGASTRLLQQFTTDKDLLRAALRDFRAKPATRGPRIAGAGMRTRAQTAAQGPEYVGGMGGSAEAAAAEARSNHEYGILVPPLMKLIETKDMLEGLGQIVAAMHELPGRKALVFLSDALSLVDGTVTLIRRDEPRVIDSGLLASVDAITELANRMSVVVHVVAPGGRHLFDNNRDPREQRSRREGDGLSELTRRTGGLYLRSGKDVTPAFQRVVQDHRGYYVLGYSPEDGAFQKKDGRAPFRTVEVRVKRPDLVVRSRAGYVGVTDAEVSADAGSRLTAAAFSPLAHRNLGVRVSSSFVHAAPRPGYPTTRAVRARVSVSPWRTPLWTRTWSSSTSSPLSSTSWENPCTRWIARRCERCPRTPRLSSSSSTPQSASRAAIRSASRCAIPLRAASARRQPRRRSASSRRIGWRFPG
jgi:VWFA-related protein